MESGKFRADSEVPGHCADFAIDGDPSSIWHTPWGDNAPPFPHELVLEFSKPANLYGITCLPRQDMLNGWIKEYAVYISADGKDWGNPVAQGSFEYTENMLQCHNGDL